jgi:CheY-like chemotaxis protein
MERLKQILVNFMSNATKYTPRGGKINLTFIETDTDDPDTTILQMSCSDTGIGIAKENQQAVFEPFNREISSTINPIEGTGLGLTIVKKIVTSMNGTIELVSEKGKGSTFTVKIPLKIDDEKKVLAQFQYVMQYETLFIADDQAMCDTVKKLFPQINGKECDTADNEQILAETASLKDTYDSVLIISQTNAPKIIQKIRKRYPEADVIYGSDMKDLAEEKDILNAGADAVLYRPVFRATLFEEYHALKVKKKAAIINDRYLEGMHVLVAEDQPVNYAVAEYILKATGAIVHKAVTGKDAVDVFLASSPGEIQIIFMDIMMPEMNGYDAAKLIRASDRSDAHSVIIVAMTANAFSEDIQKSLAAGMDGHISKPIDSALIKDTLIKILSTKRN